MPSSFPAVQSSEFRVQGSGLKQYRVYSILDAIILPCRAEFRVWGQNSAGSKRVQDMLFPRRNQPTLRFRIQDSQGQRMATARHTIQGFGLETRGRSMQDIRLSGILFRGAKHNHRSLAAARRTLKQHGLDSHIPSSGVPPGSLYHRCECSWIVQRKHNCVLNLSLDVI